MLERVLESDRHAEAAVHVESREGGPFTVTLTLHGVARAIDAPGTFEVSDDAVEASGRCELRLSDFGMAPFAILGGAIRVDDTVVVRFRIRATRLAG
jgi:polyisoprenoid-binding protein YceI